MPRRPPARVAVDLARAQDIADVSVPTGERRLVGAREVPLDQVVPDPDQPRRDWDQADTREHLEELRDSLREFGVLQPLLVRQAGAFEDGRTRYVVIAGGRRRAAAEMAGLATVPVVVRDEESAHLRVLQLTENLQRQDLAPLDEARAYQELLDLDDQLTPEALGKQLHISGQTIRNRLRLLADQVFADAVERRQISATAARKIMTQPDEVVADFRRRVEAGERLQSNDVAVARAALQAAGVANPRYKGGGRAARTPAFPAAAASTEAPIAQDRPDVDQTRFDPAETPGSPAQAAREPVAPPVGSTERAEMVMISGASLAIIRLVGDARGSAPRAQILAALREDLARLGRSE